MVLAVHFSFRICLLSCGIRSRKTDPSPSATSSSRYLMVLGVFGVFGAVACFTSFLSGFLASSRFLSLSLGKRLIF